MTRAVLFDLDGVLVDTYEVWFHLLNAAAAHWGHPAIARERFHATWGQGVEADIRTFFPGRTAAELDRFYTERFYDHRVHMEVHPQAPEIFPKLRARGVRTAIITNTPSDLAREVARSAALVPDTLVGATDVLQAKPAPDMVFLACRRLKVDLSSALVVGDSWFDMQAAKSAGVRFAGFRRAGDVELADLDGVLEILEDARPGRPGNDAGTRTTGD